MKDRRRREVPWGALGRHQRPSSGSSFWCALFVFLCCALFSAVTFSTFRLFGVSFRPVLISPWQTPTMNSVSGDGPFFPQSPSPHTPSFQIQEAVSFPDQVLLFLRSPSQLPTTQQLLCLYYAPPSPQPTLQLPPVSSPPPQSNIVRCPLAPWGFSISLSASPSSNFAPVSLRRWDQLAYAALLDRDNSTIVFAKGLNLRPARLADPARYECVFGFGFTNPKYLLTTPAISAAQEIVRCLTPLSVLVRTHFQSSTDGPFVSVHIKGRGGITLPSVACPEGLPDLRARKKQTMCVCTMVRNQARFLKEWIMYHWRIGVEHWFIYDNNSNDDIDEAIESMGPLLNSRISQQPWPWIKTQEAGFAHCALRARRSCEWVGFIDVDEFLYLPSDVTLHDVLQYYSRTPSVGELRMACHSFGPSGRKTHPSEGVMVGYTCRMGTPERHKSIVRPEALNPSLINVVHHFHLKDGHRHVNLERGVMVINHYKYQVWEVFKEKFYRRVATYVADWQDEENVGSKDRAPGLGTKAVEPPDWPSQFCEVNDIGLRDWVLRTFVDPKTGHLPW